MRALKLNNNLQVNEKRLITVQEFCNYSSLGRTTACRLAKEYEFSIKVGKRLLIDRIKFDELCDERVF